MAIHLTPTELAREAGIERREVIEKCMELGVPIFQGRIDKTLFLANLSRAGRDRQPVRRRRRHRLTDTVRSIALLSTDEEELIEMEAGTVAPAAASTGSKTIADLHGARRRAARRARGAALQARRRVARASPTRSSARSSPRSPAA